MRCEEILTKFVTPIEMTKNKMGVNNYDTLPIKRCRYINIY